MTDSLVVSLLVRWAIRRSGELAIGAWVAADRQVGVIRRD